MTLAELFAPGNAGCAVVSDGLFEYDVTFSGTTFYEVVHSTMVKMSQDQAQRIYGGSSVYILVDYYLEGTQESLTPKTCICDFFSVVMRVGCQCGGC